MLSRSMLSALLLIVLFTMLACQLLAPAPQACRVYVLDKGWTQRRQGDKITFSVDSVEWSATVDCKAGRLVDGQPARPERARETLIPVEETTYRLITADADISMAEYRANGSHVRIQAGDDYYVAVLSAAPASMGQAMIRYFMAGQATEGTVHLYCYNRTAGQTHASLPVTAAMWTTNKPALVDVICSGRGFILEVTTEITPQMLTQGPTPVPATPAPTMTPEPPGPPCHRTARC